MLKLVIKLLAGMFVAAIAIPMLVLRGVNGDTDMNFKMPDLKMPAVISDALPKASPKETVVYQWVDQKGRKQFSTTKPADGIQFTTKGYNPNANVIPTYTQEKTATVTKTAPTTKTKAIDDSGKIANPYTPDAIKQLMSDTKNIQTQINQRYKEQSNF